MKDSTGSAKLTTSTPVLSKVEGLILKETGILRGYMGQGKKVHGFIPPHLVVLHYKALYYPFCGFPILKEDVRLTGEAITCKICLRRVRND